MLRILRTSKLIGGVVIDGHGSIVSVLHGAPTRWPLATCIRNSGSFHRSVRSVQLVGCVKRHGAVSWSRLASARHQSTSDRGSREDGGGQQQEPPSGSDLVKLVVSVGSSLLVLYLLTRSVTPPSPAPLTWNEFVNDLLAKGEVSRIVVYPDTDEAVIVLYDGAQFRGQHINSLLRPGSNVLMMKIPDARHFQAKIRALEQELGISVSDGIDIVYKRQNEWANFAVLAILVTLGVLIFRGLRGTISAPTDMFASIRKAKFTRADLSTSLQKYGFKDVAGLREAKIEVMEFVDYLKSPARFQELGARIPRGALLLGPPGCGKTLLAKAVAGEAGVPFLVMAGSEFVEMLGGLGAARVRELFKEAKKLAPCIIYLDEIDAIGRNRSSGDLSAGGGGVGEEEQTLNQLLVEMDGMTSSQGVIMLASTNRSDVLDKALLRPGRFDRHIVIDLPMLEERREIFEMYLGKLKTARPASAYAMQLARTTPGMSAADIANVCNEAALHAVRVGHTVVDAPDFDHAVERVTAGAEKRSGVLSAHERRIVAYHESGHALVGWMLKHTDALLKVSIVPRTSAALGFSQYMPSDQKLYSKDELLERMSAALGGRAAEAVVFNQATTGANDDLRRVTKLAYDQICSYGLSDRIGHVSFRLASESSPAIKPYSKQTQHVMDQEARALVAIAYQTAESILKNNLDKLNLLAESLLKSEFLTYNHMVQLIGPPPHGKKSLISSPDEEIPVPVGRDAAV